MDENVIHMVTHPFRFKILQCIGEASEPLLVEQIAKVVNEYPRLVSHHLGILQEIGLVDCECKPMITKSLSWKVAVRLCSPTPNLKKILSDIEEAIAQKTRSDGKITLIEKLKNVYVPFKLFRMVLVSIAIFSTIVGIGSLFFLPSEAQLVFCLVYLSFAGIMVFSVVRLILGYIWKIIDNSSYNRKQKPKEFFVTEVKQIAKKMGIEYNLPIYVTENPSVKGPFANPFSREIMFPSSYKEKFHKTEINAIIGHELAHIKYFDRFFAEIVLIPSIIFVSAIVLAVIIWSLGVYVIWSLAIAMFAAIVLLFSCVLRRNEYRADWEGPACHATTPEALISVFEHLKAEYKRDDAITHPPFQARIDRLMSLLNSDCNSKITAGENID